MLTKARAFTFPRSVKLQLAMAACMGVSLLVCNLPYAAYRLGLLGQLYTVLALFALAMTFPGLAARLTVWRLTGCSPMIRGYFLPTPLANSLGSLGMVATMVSWVVYARIIGPELALHAAPHVPLFVSPLEVMLWTLGMTITIAAFWKLTLTAAKEEYR